jgi:hypothetical protein
MAANVEFGDAEDDGGDAPDHCGQRAADAGVRREDLAVVIAGDFNLAASDPSPGSGLDKTYYRLGSSGPFSEYDAGNKPTVSAQGTTTVEFYSTDAAGNVETAKSVTVHIDTGAPGNVGQRAAQCGNCITEACAIHVQPKVPLRAKVSERADFFRSISEAILGCIGDRHSSWLDLMYIITNCFEQCFDCGWRDLRAFALD